MVIGQVIGKEASLMYRIVGLECTSRSVFAVVMTWSLMTRNWAMEEIEAS